MGRSRERQRTYLVFPGVGIKTVELKKGLRSNAVKARIENQNVSSKCRMCGSHDEIVQHILCSCPKLAQTEYKNIYMMLLGESYIGKYARNMELSAVTNGMSIPPKV